MHTCQDLCILVYLLSDCAAGKLAEISMSQCLNVKSIFVLINMLHTISTLIHFVTLDYAVLLHILLGQTACIWAKAEKGPKSTTLFASDALATSRGILTGGGSGASPKKKIYSGLWCSTYTAFAGWQPIFPVNLYCCKKQKKPWFCALSSLYAPQ